MQPGHPYEDPYVPKKKGSASKAIIIGAIVVAALIIGGGIFWLTSRATDKQASEWDETEYGYVEEVADPEFSDVKPSGASTSVPFDYTAMVCFRELTPADLTGCPKAELRLMRNTIYARHGYMFQSADLQEYFSQFDWYEPRLNVVTENDMSEIERKNVALIKRFE
jgi:protein containing caspase domain